MAMSIGRAVLDGVLSAKGDIGGKEVGDGGLKASME
jgi:hypothetical protein